MQSISLTAHREQTILERFPRVYSLKLASAYGKEAVYIEKVESGFYALDAAEEDAGQIRWRL